MMNTKKLYLANLLFKFLPPTHFFSFKNRLLRWCGAVVGKNVQIFTPSIQGNCNLILEDNVWIGHQALIFGAAGSTIQIKEHAKIGSRSILVTGYHEYSIQYENIAGPGKYADIIIEKGACIGTQAIVLPGKIVGMKSHVAAGSIVTHDVPSFTRVAGIPAKVIKEFQN